MTEASARRLRRLAEELEESGLVLAEASANPDLILDEVDHALRPAVHERRVASSGAILDPASAPDSWAAGTQLHIARTRVGHPATEASRRFSDGLSSWLVRRSDGSDEWVMFDRTAGSERDLVVLAGAFAGTVVQRHPSGSVRVVGDFGVLRWNGLGWHHEPPLARWIGVLAGPASVGDQDALAALLEFALHDLGSLGIGALLVYRPHDGAGATVEHLLPAPPALHVRTAYHLAPLRHALTQVDGAAVFDRDGTLAHIGVRLIPSAAAEAKVEALGGTRHTSARRYSFDAPDATVIAISEDGPVSVFRGGTILGTSAPYA